MEACSWKLTDRLHTVMYEKRVNSNSSRFIVFVFLKRECLQLSHLKIEPIYKAKYTVAKRVFRGSSICAFSFLT